LAMAH